MATSAYQVEGAVREGGRGVSIWDVFSHTPGRIAGGDTGDVACDQYHRFDEDVALMSELDVGAYRFSVAWPRIQPEGRGPANRAGLDHYRALVDSLNQHAITPVLTLHHWDLPQALEDRGGWADRDTALRFADYAEIVYEALAGEVPIWITLNEPWVAAWLGYGTGVHAPGRTDNAAALAASHHLLLAHGRAMEVMDGADVGIALNLQPVVAASDDPDDVEAARIVDLHTNALFIDPLFGRGYPADLVERYRPISDLSFVRDGDLQAIARPLSFLGVNYYRPHHVTADAGREGRREAMPGSLDAWAVVPPGLPVTTMGWTVEPPRLTELLTGLHRDYAPARIVVTENGAAFDDEVGPDGAIDDADRISYLADHVAAAHESLRAGVPLTGFFVWSLLDNFEWAEGYRRRFGLVHVDYPTQRRTPKASARWFGQVIRGNALPG